MAVLLEVGDFYAGESLRKAVFETPDERKFLVHSLIPEHSINMFYAPDGIGKSTLLLQIALETCSNLNIFGGLPSDENINCLYIMTERHRFEAFERIKLMSTVLNIKWENFMLTDKLQGFNILNETDFKRFIDKALALTTKFENRKNKLMINIDPIYAIVPKKLVGEEGAGSITSLCRRFQSEGTSAVNYNHHANRGIKNQATGEREYEDMYGGRFLSANCTGVYKISGSKTGTSFVKEKDSLQGSILKFNLTYNPETHISLMNPDDSIPSKIERIRQFLKNSYVLKKDFTFDELVAIGNLSHAHARREVMIKVNDGTIINTNPKGIKALYKILREP